MSIARILCPVDLSDLSHQALQQAVALARRHQAALTVLHVFSVAPVAAAAPAGSPLVLDAPRLSTDARTQLEAALRRFTALVPAAGVAISYAIEDGDPHDTIVDVARRLPADLIVISTHARRGLNRLLLGSVVEEVLRTAPCPVLTVPPNAGDATAEAFGRILCAVDFDTAAGAALEHAAMLATNLEAEVFVLHVIDQPAWHPITGAAAPPLAAEYSLDLKRSTAARLETMIPPSLRSRAHMRELVTMGTPAHEIVHVADEELCDLIVLGAERHLVPPRFERNSTIQHVLRAALCPVLTIRPPRSTD